MPPNTSPAKPVRLALAEALEAESVLHYRSEKRTEKETTCA
jgi:hypothetical protein